MHDRHHFGKRFEHQRPVQRGVAAADDHNVLADVLRRIGDEVCEAAAQVVATRRQRARTECPDPAGDHDRPALDAQALRGGDRERTLAAFEFDGLVPEQIVRIVRRGLLHQLLDEIATLDRREPGDIEDRLLGIHRGDLPARLLQRVEDGGLELAHARVIGAEQANGSGADD